MNLAADAPAWLVILLAALLLYAAIEDSIRLRIANITCLLILIAAIVAAFLVGPEWSLWENFAVFAGLLAVGMPLFNAGKFGGGDVKLFACTGLWFSLWGAVYLLGAVLIAGGLLALLLLVLRAGFRGKAAAERVRILKRGAGIPYGVAIAIGAMIVIAQQRGVF